MFPSIYNIQTSTLSPVNYIEHVSMFIVSSECVLDKVYPIVRMGELKGPKKRNAWH